jgi:hypothetical protein
MRLPSSLVEIGIWCSNLSSAAVDAELLLLSTHQPLHDLYIRLPWGQSSAAVSFAPLHQLPNLTRLHLPTNPSGLGTVGVEFSSAQIAELRVLTQLQQLGCSNFTPETAGTTAAAAQQQSPAVNGAAG